MREFIIRIDLESQKGIKEGVPQILGLFKKYNIKGSFYLVMGGESNIFEILNNKNKLRTAGERKIKIWSLKDKLRMAFYPLDFVSKNKKLLRKIILDGHELGIHGWKHRSWTRNLEKLDIGRELDKSVRKYKNIFGQSPISFSAPGFNINKNVLLELRKRGIFYISDFDRMENIFGLKNIPIVIKGKDKTPFIEYWIGEKKEDEEILESFKKEIKDRKFVSFYLHGLFEGRFKIDLLEKIILELKNQKFISKRIIDY